MAELPETAVIVSPSDINNDVEQINLIESTQSEMKATTKEDQQKTKHKVIKIKVLMIRQSSPFYVYISTSCTILELKKEIEKVNNNQITADKQRLIYKGHALKNKDTIFQCNIKDSHAIHLVPQKSKPKPNDTNVSQQQTHIQPIIDHMPYKNVVCPKCHMNLCLTQPMLCYASFWVARDENNTQFTLSQIVNGCNKAVNDNNINNNTPINDDNKSENKPEFDESKHGAHCDMQGCLTPNIRSTDYCYHCPNRRCHPFGYDLCQNCARYVDNPFVSLNIATNHVLRYQLNMFSDIFYDRYRMLINRAIGGQLNDDEIKQESKEESKQSQQLQQRERNTKVAQITVKMGGIDYVKVMDDGGNVLLIPKRRMDELKRREKPLTINELRDNICNPNSEFRKKISAVVANPRLIREIFQKECPNLMRDNLWIRKFVTEAFEYIECRIYIQARMALNLQDMMQIVNEIINELAVIRQNNKKTVDNKILLRTFKILKANSTEWIADDKVTKCQYCGNSFNYFTRKHHCKACGDIFCAKHCVEYICKPNRSLMPNRTLQNLRVRLCDECKTKYSHYTYTNIPKQKQ